MKKRQQIEDEIVYQKNILNNSTNEEEVYKALLYIKSLEWVLEA